MSPRQLSSVFIRRVSGNISRLAECTHGSLSLLRSVMRRAIPRCRVFFVFLPALALFGAFLAPLDHKRRWLGALGVLVLVLRIYVPSWNVPYPGVFFSRVPVACTKCAWLGWVVFSFRDILCTTSCPHMSGPVWVHTLVRIFHDPRMAVVFLDIVVRR